MFIIYYIIIYYKYIYVYIFYIYIYIILYIYIFIYILYLTDSAALMGAELSLGIPCTYLGRRLGSI